MGDTVITRRSLLARTGGAGLALLMARALPIADALAQTPLPIDSDGLLQAFADTILPGRKVERTALGAAIHPQAIAGVDDQPGAVEADVLALFHHPKIGFDALAPGFFADLAAKGGAGLLEMGYDARVAVLEKGLDFANPTRTLWEAAAAVPFTAFCAAAVVPEQTADKAVGYRVMGLPGRAPRGYRGSSSYRRKLARERTKKGYLA